MKGGIIMARHNNAGRKTSPLQMLESDARLALIANWLRDSLHLKVRALEPASSDASFRRYFRAVLEDATYIVMDAPPPQEDVRPYLKVTGLLEPLGVHVPHVHAHDATQGLLLLEDLGTTQYLARLEAADDPDALYADALAALAKIQVRGAQASLALAPYGRAELLRELSLMPEWFLGRHLGLAPAAADARLIDTTFEFLIAEALAQPAVFVHRDYHSRNLMLTRSGNPGVIDFQDALRGPIGYDLVSLLKDCYISWPRTRVVRWVRAYRERLMAAGASDVGADEAQFLRWFDLIGVQRHAKVLGIFCRLWYRDGKSGYLGDLPRTLAYVREACTLYPELAAFGRYLEAYVVAALAQANAAALAAERT
jgi:aminoglycoside/choline kinase family phosphotransferase